MKNTAKILISLFIVCVCLVLASSSELGALIARAQGPDSSHTSVVEETEYYTHLRHTRSNGTIVEEAIINGPPTPPPGYESQRAPILVDKSRQPTATKTLNVPAYDWVFGCSSVSGAMIAAYYDRNGFPNMYTGPTNGGVMPMDNSIWGSWSDGVDTYPNIPLAASHNGVDGRASRGSIDDYWVEYGSSANDPYIPNGWGQHPWGDAIGDYMKTSQSAYNNDDGSTAFYFLPSGPYTCANMVTLGDSTHDGTYGRKLFYEARGYTVTDCYTEKTDNNGGAFTFARYKAEIDASRPVMLNLHGHTVVGIGYDDSTNSVQLNDTWNHSSDHWMTWGTSYNGMALEMVSIVNLQQTTPPSSASSLYLPLIARQYYIPLPPPSPTGPTPGWWSGSDGDPDFYVSPDRKNVLGFEILVFFSCGPYWIRRNINYPSAITNNSFSFSGSYYASGTFDSTMIAHGTTGLSSFGPVCGYYWNGGPWTWNATWQDSSQPYAPVRAAGPDEVQVAPGSGNGYVATPAK